MSESSERDQKHIFYLEKRISGMELTISSFQKATDTLKEELSKQYGKSNQLLNEIDRLRAELAAEREKHRWIQVSERLPKDYRPVLIYAAMQGQVLMGVHISAIPQWSSAGYIYYHGGIYTSITHWMPLPQPPEVKDD